MEGELLKHGVKIRKTVFYHSLIFYELIYRV